MLKKYNDQKLSEVLKGMVDNKKWKGKLFQTKVKELWVLNMGTSISSYTTNINLRGYKLFITISSAPLRQELAYNKDKIKNIINEGLGEEYVKDVVIR